MTIFLKKEEILIFSLYFLELMTKAFLILMQLPKSFKQIKSDFGVSSLCWRDYSFNEIIEYFNEILIMFIKYISNIVRIKKRKYWLYNYSF